MKNYIYLKPDSRRRVALTKVSEDNSVELYRAYSEGGKIVLEPVKEISDEDAWLFRPENKEILKEVKEGLEQREYFSLGSFKKYLP